MKGDKQMQKKKVVIILTTLVVLAIAFLSVTTVFRVRGVTVETEVISEVAKEEAQVLQKRLLEAYKHDSSFLVKDKKAKEIIEEFPYFRLTGFEKSYPDRITVSVAEHVESYAVKKADSEEYYIIGEDGLILSIRESSLNRFDNSPNVIIEGEGLNVSGEKGQKLVGDSKWDALLQFCNRFSEKLNGLRDNVTTVTVSKYAPEYCLIAREGVKIYVGTPETMTVEKSEAAAEKYLSLTDAERMKGMIMVESKDGEVLVSYENKDFTT